jgi:hypothetical protein
MGNMKKQILVGADSFEKIVGGNYFYVDKTLFIKELLENRGEVTLITRPRRFGKTLNMSMLRYFFDVNMDSKALFEGLNITDHKDIVEKHQNKYPVIFLTLKDVAFDTFHNTIENIRGLISDIYQKNLLKIYEKWFPVFFRKICMYTKVTGSMNDKRNCFTLCF